ncbi:MAG TPA: RdgB/HAM1 family non-canonical purine NTP pyrophosphatase [Rectinemataceae bacterium]|nr:RdgB/HAM1 family non-canonical purine NTP pyrophosphatase [Rectinemataceae bacterium]
MELFVATANPHKLLELAPALPGHTLRTPLEAGIGGFHVLEDGATFLENALKKAVALHRILRRPILADDSGLVVDALNGEPGVRSARYGSPDGGATKLGAAERNRFLLEQMAGYRERSCAFVCCLVLMVAENRVFSIQETCPGELLREPRGSGGFGYDPVVWLPDLGKTVAELSTEEKNRISHRGRACARLAGLLEELETRP